MKLKPVHFIAIIGACLLLAILFQTGRTEQEPTPPAAEPLTPAEQARQDSLAAVQEAERIRRDSVQAIAREQARIRRLWSVSESADAITGKKNAYINSREFSPVRPMEFPYHDTKMKIGFGCDSGNEWGYLHFTNAPNLVNDETKSGYSISVSRVRWNDTPGTLTLRQDWGENFLHFEYDRDAIRKITQNETLLIELEWHGSGRVLFEANLEGSADAIARARSLCGR